jgi:glycosyltransferase involved in cell wall biosynthesis
LRGLHLALERWSVRRAAWTYVFSRSGASRLARDCPRVSYLPTWYDPAVVVERSMRSARPPSALWVGRFEEEKDPRLGLAVLERFVARADGRRAVMIGDGALLPELRRARMPGACVELSGRRNPAEVAVAMAEADVLLMTSRFEGSPVVMSEALAAGTPVVATDESDPDERIEQGHNGVRVAGRDPDALAVALETALELDRRSCIESVRDLAAPHLVPRVFDLAPESPR